MAEYSVQQQKIINQYRQSNNLGFVISDDEVVSIMQKEMQKTGKVYPGFENLAVSKKGNKEPKKEDSLIQIGPNKNLFGGSRVRDLSVGVTLERFEHNYAVLTPTQSQADAIDFLKDITTEADSIVKERDKEAGTLSSIVNTWQEIFNKEYARSTVQKEISKTKQDLTLLEKASKGEPIAYDFLGEPIIQTFEETFRNARGVEFSEKNIQDCQEKALDYAQVKTAVEMINKTKENLSFVTKGDVTSQMSPEKASRAIIDAFKLSGVNSKEEINKTLKDINEKYKDHPDVKKYGGDFRIAKNKQGKYVIYRTAQNGYPAEATNEELKLIANELSTRLDKSLATALGVEYNENATPEELSILTQNTLEQFQKVYENSFKKAYGKKDLKVLSEQYVQKQQQGVANIEMGLNIVSMAMMVVPGGAVASSKWALKGSLALKGSVSGAKVVKGLSLVDNAKKGVRIAQDLQKAQQVLSPVIMANMTLRPTELLEQLTSENGMSTDEWQAWGEGVLQNTVYMSAGMGVSKIAEQGAALYKTKALVNTLKQAGKSTDEIAAMVKSNPVKFPNDIVKSFKKIDTLAKTLQVSNEVALDISSTYLLNKVMGNGDVTKQDWINSVAFAISGGVLQKQFAHLDTESKVKYIHDAFKEYGVTKEEAQNILKTMDGISEGLIRVKDTKGSSSKLSINDYSNKIFNTPELKNRKLIFEKVSLLEPEYTKALQQTLGKKYFDQIKWEELIPDWADAQDIKKIVVEMNESAKYFSRLSVSEQRYGKNFAWAKKVNSIAYNATQEIVQGNDIEGVLATIADGYKNIDSRKIKGFDEVGRLREDFDPEEPRFKGDVVTTPFSKEKNIYAEYADRLTELNALSDDGVPEMHKKRRKQCKYSAWVVEDTIRSGSVHDIKLFQSDINANYEKLKPLFNKIKDGQKLSQKELEIAHDNISELYYRIANFCPYERGTNGIADIFMRSMYNALNIDMPPLKKGVSLDLESFCVDLESYRKNWKTFFEANDSTFLNQIPKGLNTEDEVLVNNARTENPADAVAEKVKEQWQQADLNTSAENNPIDLFNLDSETDVRTSAPAVNGDVTSLVLTGKLKEKLTQHYEELGNVFKDIAKNHRADFNALAKEYGQDKQKFADGVIKIISEEFGMQGYEPKIEFTDINGVDGLANWPKGTIQISNNANNAKKLIEIISHEFTHMLQYRDIIAQYGEQGLREVVMNDNSIPTQNKEAKIKEILESPFTARLLDNYNNLKNSEEGALNEYLTRIYKNEFANPINPDTDMQGYVNQATEREAYNLGSQELGNNVDGLENAYVGDGNWQIEEGEIQEINGKKFRINSDGTITRLNSEALPAGISSGMSDAEFNIKGNDLCQRADGSVSPAAKALLESIKNSELENNSYDVNNFKLEDFRKMSRDYKNNLLSDEMLGYAKELVDSIPKGKDHDLLTSSDFVINKVICNQLEYAKPEVRRQIVDALKQLFSNPNVRNGVVSDIIEACTEGNYKDGYTFNKEAFDSIYNLFEKKIENRKHYKDYSYSLMIAEIAKNAINYEKDANGNYVQYFDDIGFKIGMILPEADPYGHYVHYDLTKDRSTGEINLHNIDQDTQNYITRKAEENYFQAQKERSEYNWRTSEYETKIYHDEYAETLRNLCMVDGKLDVQNCFAVDYMINDLEIGKAEVVKNLENYRNQDGVLDMPMLRLIKNKKKDYDKVGVLNSLQKLDQDISVLYNEKGNLNEEVLQNLKNAPITRSMTLRTSDYFWRYKYNYDISNHYMTDGKIDFKKLKSVESDLSNIVKMLGIKCDNAYERCTVSNLYNTIKANPDDASKILEAAKKCGMLALGKASDKNGKGIDLDELYYYASLPDDLYKLIQNKSWLIPFVKGEPVINDVKWYIENDLNPQDKVILDKHGINIDYVISSKKNQFIRKSEVSNQAQNQLEHTIESLDNALANADVNRGIELEYTRAQFERDLIDAVKDLPQARANDILNSFGLTLRNGKIEGIIAKPQIDAPQNLANIEQKIKQCIEKFQNNRVLNSDPSLNSIYTSLTKDFPEFAMLVGKIGSDGQRVDVTVLSQMQSLIDKPQYKELSSQEQKMAKLTLMLRVFDEVDSTPNITAKSFTTDNDGMAINAKHKRYKNGDFAWAILERFNLTDVEKYAITDLVAHSGWSKEYNEGVVDIGIAREYDPDWIKRNGVMPYPDINPENNANKVAVNTRFGTLKLSKLIEDIINPNNNIDTTPIEAVQKRVYQNMQMVNSVTAKDLEPYWETQIIDGVECQVIDLRKTKLPDDFYLMGHFTEHGVSNLYNLLSNKNDKVFFSNSLLKANSVSTFAGRTEGIISEFDNRNVAETHRYNIDSGFGKSYNDFVEIMYGKGKRDIKNIVKENLGLSNEEYGLLMEQIVDKRLSELDNYYNINGRYLSKQEIIDAHNAAYENMLKSGGEQNEITILNQTPIAFVYSASKTYQGQCPFSMKNSPLKRVIIFP